MRVKCKAVKEMFKNGEYRIIAFEPITPYPKELSLSKYFSFTCCGEYPYIIIDKTYELEIEELKRDKYGVSYKILSVPSLDEQDFHNLSKDEAMEIMMDITSSERIANNILDAYPQFIEIVLTDGQDAIDTKLIAGVGNAYLSAYVRNITNKYKYYHIIKKLTDYKIDITDCKNLLAEFKDEQGIQKALKDKPYYVLIENLSRKFEQVDKMLMEIRPELNDSKQRCEALMMTILRLNEQEGSTRLSGNVLYRYMRDEYNTPQLLPLVKDVAMESEIIYYDEKYKDLSVRSTYLGELKIADFIKEKLANNKKLNIDIEKYRNIGEFSLSDMQMNGLKNFCDSNVSIIAGYSGCVDGDTEYFNGKEWKPIDQYTEGDDVLQWNEDGSATLVKPLDYIKKPCNKMYHFDTKYGLNQTLSPEHRVAYITSKGNLNVKQMKDLVKMHESGQCGFTGKFMTTFNYSGKGIDLTNNEIKLMCAIICDGSFHSFSENKEYLDSYLTCRFHIKKERKKIALRKLFEESSTEYREVKSACDGYTDFYIKAPRREKEFSSYWYDCTSEQLKVICENIIQWDGSISITKKNKERLSFSTTIKQTADFIQFAFATCGYRVTMRTDDRIGRVKVNKDNGKEYTTKSICYELSITNRNMCGLNWDSKRGDKTEIHRVIPKDNMKYCFTVPSSFLVLRRANKIFITGNSGKSQSAKGLVQLMEDNGLSYLLLSSTGKASKVLGESCNRRAYTVHKKCYEGDINVDVCLIDEAGMIALDTMCMLVNAIANPNMRIVMLGDP